MAHKRAEQACVGSSAKSYRGSGQTRMLRWRRRDRTLRANTVQRAGEERIKSLVKILTKVLTIGIGALLLGRWRLEGSRIRNAHGLKLTRHVLGGVERGEHDVLQCVVR